MRSKIGIARRSVMLGIILAFGVASTAGQARSSERPYRVLFVCRAGTVKSAVARELFRRRADERGLNATAISRGLVPEDHVSPALRQHLVVDRLDTARDPLRKLSAGDVASADLVVFFDPLPANLHPRQTRDWTATPSLNDDYASARTDLDRRIDGLLDDLEAGATKPR